MLLASVHFSSALTIPVAVALSGLLVWYWQRLGRDGTPASRRKIRRFSLLAMLISLPMFVRALSFVDPAIDRRQYVLAWTAITVVVLIIIATALMDAINNLRLHQHQRHDAITQAATDLALAIRERKRQQLAGARRDHAAPPAAPSTDAGADGQPGSGA